VEDVMSSRLLHAGITRALAQVFKAGQRAQLLPLAAQLWPAAAELASSEAAAASVLSRCAACPVHVQLLGVLPAN
jgi:hypothetical protein